MYQKDISEEPFFGVDIGQNDLFSDLSDLSFPKDKGDLLQFPKKENLSSDLKVLSGKDAENILNKLLKKSEELNKKTDQETGKNITQLKEGQTIKLDELPIRLIKNFDTDFRLNDLTNEGYTKEQAEVLIKAKNILKAGEETNANEALLRVKEEMADQQGIDVDEVDFDFQLENPEPIDDFDMAEGGRINFQGGGASYSKSSSKSKSSQSNSPGHPANQGKKSSSKSKSSQSNSPGHPANQGKKSSTKKTTTVTTGGKSPFTYTKPKNKIVTKLKTANTGGKTPYQKYADHAKFTENMKNYGKLKNYHQLGGYDFMKRFDANPTLAKALGYGYQGLSEGIKSLNPFDDYTFMDAMKRAKHEGDLNALGIEAYKDPDSAIAKQYDTLSPSGYGYDIMKVKK